MRNDVINTYTIKLYIFLLFFRFIQRIFFPLGDMLAQSVFVYAIGIIAIIFMSVSIRSNGGDIGYTLNPFNIGLSFLIVLVACAVSFGAVFLVERNVIDSIGATRSFNWLTDFYYASPVNSVALGGKRNFLLMSGGAVFYCMCSAFFLETFFRGFLLERFRYITNFWVANLLQSVLFTLWMMLMPMRYFMESGITKTTVLIAVCYAANAFIKSFRIGMIRNITGTLWAPLLDYFLVNLFVIFVHINSSIGMLDYYRMLAIQVVALLVYGCIYFLRWFKEKEDEKCGELSASEQIQLAERNFQIGGLCCVFGAGEAPTQFPDITDALVIAADGGYDYLARYGVRPDLIVGDFDSLGYIPMGIETVSFPVEKDDTDMGLAIVEGLRRGAEEFRIYGGTGGRPDHTVANIQCLARLSRDGKRAVLVGNGFEVTAITDGELRFDDSRSGFVSVFAFGDTASGVCESGLKYSLDMAELRNDFPVGVSNEFCGCDSCISVEKGTLIVFYAN